METRDKLDDLLDCAVRADAAARRWRDAQTAKTRATAAAADAYNAWKAAVQARYTAEENERIAGHEWTERAARRSMLANEVRQDIAGSLPPNPMRVVGGR